MIKIELLDEDEALKAFFESAVLQLSAEDSDPFGQEELKKLYDQLVLTKRRSILDYKENDTAPNRARTLALRL